MLTILLFVLECLRELFLVVVVGGFVAIASAGLVVYILAKLLGVDRLRELAELEERLDLLLAEEHMHEVEDDYFDDDELYRSYLEDGGKILYDEEDTQEYELYRSYLEDDDYILTEDGEKILYDEDTQE